MFSLNDHDHASFQCLQDIQMAFHSIGNWEYMTYIFFWSHFWIIFSHHFKPLLSKDQYVIHKLYFKLFEFIIVMEGKGCHIKHCNNHPSQPLGLPYNNPLVNMKTWHQCNYLGVKSYITPCTKYISDKGSGFIWRQRDIVLTVHK